MDLKYYDDNGNGEGKWVSLKAVCGVEGVEDTSVNDDSTFSTPNYITNKILCQLKNGYCFSNLFTINSRKMLPDS